MVTKYKELLYYKTADRTDRILINANKIQHLKMIKVMNLVLYFDWYIYTKVIDHL